jgi:large subunit ribosomal protein L19e
MNLSKKKSLTKRTFNVGDDRIIFVDSRLNEIKEAITKQDIRDLQKSGAIIIKEIHGRKNNPKRKNRSIGNVRKKIGSRKRNYVIMTRKLRKYARSQLAAGKISKENLKDAGKKIRNKYFRSKAHMKEHFGGNKK